MSLPGLGFHVWGYGVTAFEYRMFTIGGCNSIPPFMKFEFGKAHRSWLYLNTLSLSWFSQSSGFKHSFHSISAYHMVFTEQ